LASTAWRDKRSNADQSSRSEPGQPVEAPQQGGVLGFDEYGFVGITRVSSTTLAKLLNAAKALHDSVLFCPDGTGSIVLIDHYRVSGMPRDVGYSVVVQGQELEAKLAACFENVTRLEGRAR